MRSGNKWAMKKTLIVFLLSLFSANAFAGYGGYIGTHDDRRYGSLSEPEYHGVAKLTANGLVKGTGVFVSKNIILTNSHVVFSCKNGCVAEFWNGSEYEKANIKALKYNKNSNRSNGADWGLLLSDKDNNFYKSIAQKSITGRVMRGGYGALRIIKDEEIPFLKKLYDEINTEHQKECKESPNEIECYNLFVEKRLKEMGKEPLFKDENNFKVQICNILGESRRNNKMMETDCDSSGGDSGAPLLRYNTIVGLNNSGKHGIFGDSIVNAEALKTENFYDEVQEIIKSNQYFYSKGSDKAPLEPPLDFDEDKDLRPDSVPDEYSDIESEMLQEFDCD